MTPRCPKPWGILKRSDTKPISLQQYYYCCCFFNRENAALCGWLRHDSTRELVVCCVHTAVGRRPDMPSRTQNAELKRAPANKPSKVFTKFTPYSSLCAKYSISLSKSAFFRGEKRKQASSEYNRMPLSSMRTYTGTVYTICSAVYGRFTYRRQQQTNKQKSLFYNMVFCSDQSEPDFQFHFDAFLHFVFFCSAVSTERLLLSCMILRV